MSKKIIASMVALACSISPVMVYSAESEQPNVLVIIMDDLGTGQLDFTLDSLERETLDKRQVAPRYQGDIAKMIDAAARSMPNVANLAHNGVKMTNAFVAHPVCGPSRAGIFTGRHPASFGTYSNDDASQGIPLDVTLLPKLLQDNGYATATIGKWHNARVESKNLVPENTRTRDYHDNEVTVTSKGYEPNERGFDYSYSYYASGAALWNSPAIWVNGKNVPSHGYLTHNLTNETIKFINSNKDKPFFINLSYSVPHIPLEQSSPARYMEKFNTGNIEADKYFAAINAADEGIGQILDTLKKRDELDNTLIFFLSDNGAVHESPMPLNGMDRGFKGQMYNGGVRVPFIVSWPNKIPGGQVSDIMVSALDILPTALSSAGIEIPGVMHIDGKDIMPVLSGVRHDSPHDYLYWAGPGAKHYSEDNDKFWSGYWKWITYQENVIPSNPNLEKLSPGSWAIRDGEWALYFYDDGGKISLFNDKLNPSESKDLSLQYPDRVKKMKSAFYDWIKNKPKPVAWGSDRYQVLTTSAQR
jgi:uncharacterized sulfatase